MFRVVSAIVFAAGLTALLSAQLGRGSLEQFELTVVPSVWTFLIAVSTAAWAFALRGTRDLWVRAGLASLAVAIVTVAPRETLLVLAGGLAVDCAGRRLRPAAPIAVAAVGLVALLQLPAFWWGLLLNGSDVDEAKAYCESFVPKLEAHFDRNGTYPRSLNQLPLEMGEVPRLVDPASFYTVTGNRYQLSFPDPSGLDQGQCYDSFVGSWRKWSRPGALALADRWPGR